MTTELHEGPLEAAPTIAKAKPTWREQRRIRRRRRIWFEEILGWILVPIIVLGCYWAVETAMNAMGTSVSTVVDGVKAILHAL
ncbi:hypothetical protein [Microvirga thermotolerans]|uniref:Uncharacterized protein n=1 Tax=Microvirga thermotolerans TaxID=2651334 RepID=A0A5P9JV39_9HYPH|nr:hypothetical protein [Microvirga thermotolerans]QFU16682.1 hypothetical protein GDR74_10820 [Microvirga thermotolerans]